MTFDVARIRKDFPILERQVRGGQPLAYLDSANTSQKPRQVIDAMSEFYERHNANIHRASHQLGEEATAAYEGARMAVAAFIGAADPSEVVFTKNISEGINLVAYAMSNAATAGQDAARFAVGPGDEIVITEMEHHADIVPWQLVCKLTGAHLKVAPINASGELIVDKFIEALTPEVKFAGVVHVSNVLGTVNPVKLIAERAHQVGALVLADAAQSVPHQPVDVQDLGVDFLGFTSHKMCGPTGIGVLWARRELLEAMPPFLGGGEMIETVKMECSTYAGVPHKFEAGTPPIVEAVGLGAALEYLGHLGLDAIHAHEQAITRYALEGLQTVPGLTVLGPLDAALRGGAISFEVAGVHPHDVAQVLDSRGVAVRAGHHCAKPAHARFGVQSSTRMSSYLYTTPAEIDALVEALEYTRSYFKLG